MKSVKVLNFLGNIFADIPRNPTGKMEKPKLCEIYGADKLIAEQNLG